MSYDALQLYYECTCVLVEPFPRLRTFEKNFHVIYTNPELYKEYVELIKKERDYYRELANKRDQLIRLFTKDSKVLT